MATIENYQNSAGVTLYRVRYRKPDGSQTSKRGFTTKRDARKFLNTVEVSKHAGTYIDPTKGNLPVEHFAESWLANKKASTKPSVYQTYESRWRIHVAPRWGKIAIVKVDPETVQKWVNSLSDGTAKTCMNGKPLSGSLISACFTVLVGSLDVARKQKTIPINPLREEVELPARITKPKLYLTHNQVRELAEASTHPEIIYTLAYTGMRWGELTALRVKNIDTTARRIRIDSSITQLRKAINENRFAEGAPKNGERRSIVYPQLLAPIIDEQIRRKQGEDFVFMAADGGHIKPPSSQTGWFALALKKAGFPHMAVHDLRHTTASLAVQAGANVKALQRMLGHASAAMTLDKYADLFDDDLIRVADALDTAFSNQN